MRIAADIMQLFRRNSFAHKMIMMALLASSLAAGTLMVTFLVYDRMSSHAELSSRLSTLADVEAENSTAALGSNDPAAATEVLQALRAEPPIVSACLYDNSGRLFAQYQRQPGNGSCAADRLQLTPLDEGYVGTTRPVVYQQDQLGTMYVSSDLQDVNHRRKQVLLVGCLLVLAAVTVGGFSASLLQREISRPLFELARAMHGITSEEDFRTRVAVSGNDEVARLGEGFNTMIAELERREAQKKNFEAKLRFQASNDALTGLPNRRLFADRLAQTLALAVRERRMVALLYIDLDGFKFVNDTLGHSMGDSLLVEVARRFASRMRRSDTLARLGGDEFTVILAGPKSRDDAAVVAGHLLETLALPIVIDGHELNIGASIGISIYPDTAKDAGDLLQQADSAMYSAKRNGKNQASYFTSELGSNVRDRHNLETELRGAIARGEITVHYQPEFDVASKRLVRFEALARWTHPTLGTVPPDQFIPVAEENGLIVALGSYILECACREAVKWQDTAPYPVQVAVNVSSVQFGRDRFVEDVTGILELTGLKPELLQLELTESVMLTGVHRSAETMKRLRALGVSLAIDDFGTGYSCLSYLPALPFDALKIDRSFVKDLGHRHESTAMIHSLVALAHNIGMRVIVEGVEKEEQLELIQKYGGNEIQGYLMGRPTADPASQIAALVENQADGSSDLAAAIHRQTLALPSAPKSVEKT
jgi:diguanylate cyclase (GGDEF)-like protein